MNGKTKEARRDYYRRWREKHPENVKRAQATFWERKALQMEKEAREQDPDPDRGEA